MRRKRSGAKEKVEWRAARMRDALAPIATRPVRGSKIGEGGYGKVYALDERLVVKVVPIPEQYRQGGLSATDLKNPFRELAIYRHTNRLVERGLTDHIALLAGARRTRSEVRMYLERFDSSVHDWLKSGPSDGALRSVVLQALHGYYVAQRELGLSQSDFNETNVLVKRTAVPRVWVWLVEGREYSCESHGYLACIADFGASEIEAIPRVPLAERQEALRAHFEAMAPVTFIHEVLCLAIRCKVAGPFTEKLARFLYDHVLYQRSDEAPPSTSISLFWPTATREPLSVARIFALCAL
jgi:hypothetical protein